MLNVEQDRNKWFLTTKFEIVAVKFIIETSSYGKNIFLYGSKISNVSDYFEYPIKSSQLNIYQVNCDRREPPISFTLNDIYCKMVKVDYDSEKSIFSPLIHTIKKN